MNKYLLYLIGIRTSAMTLALTGNAEASRYLYALADLIEAGKATDEHMQLVADKLKNGLLSKEDWDNLMARIDAEHQALQN